MSHDEFMKSSFFPTVAEASAHYESKLASSVESVPRMSVVGQPLKVTTITEVDVKLWEARQCLSLGLNISAIVISCVCVEECLKALIKSKRRSLDARQPNSLEELDEQASAVEEVWGTKSLHKSIGTAYSLGIVTVKEKEWLLSIEAEIRNAFVHSDKTRMFSKDKNIPIQEVSIEEEHLVVRDEALVSGLGLFHMHGIMQFQYAQLKAPSIVESFYDFIIDVTDRYYSK